MVACCSAKRLAMKKAAYDKAVKKANGEINSGGGGGKKAKAKKAPTKKAKSKPAPPCKACGGGNKGGRSTRSAT